jgi:hypothetical protein
MIQKVVSQLLWRVAAATADSVVPKSLVSILRRAAIDLFSNFLHRNRSSASNRWYLVQWLIIKHQTIQSTSRQQSKLWIGMPDDQRKRTKGVGRALARAEGNGRRRLASEVVEREHDRWHSCSCRSDHGFSLWFRLLQVRGWVQKVDKFWKLVKQSNNLSG